MKRLFTSSFLIVLFTMTGFAQDKKPADAPATGTAATPEFFIHAFHAQKLGSLECSLCHVPVKEGSVTLQRPGHAQCQTCHDDDFNKDIKQVICAQCHSTFPPGGQSDLVKFPRYSKTRAILFEFSHARHVDSKVRLDPTTGFRSDCTFCHKFEADGIYAKFPTHAECTVCHSKPGITPVLTASTDSAGCRGCHTPEEIENPGFTKTPHMIGEHVASGKYVNIRFTHVAHFKEKEAFGIQCTTCHYAVPRSTSLASLTLPKMLDCVECHDTSKKIATNFRMANCSTCHVDSVATAPGATPMNHTRNLKPDFHNESFRQHHESEATEPGAKCFVCHLNVSPSLQGKAQCSECHDVMRPATHTARWKDDLHGKFAAIDRQNCALCHQADYCSRCHNELPRSHVPLPLWKAGSHAFPAMLDERSCLTCHTFANTCSECHLNQLPSATTSSAKKKTAK